MPHRSEPRAHFVGRWTVTLASLATAAVVAATALSYSLAATAPPPATKLETAPVDLLAIPAEIAAPVALYRDAFLGVGSPTHLLATGGTFETRRIGAGRLVYDRYCVGCHGAAGDGVGVAERFLSPKPRNFQFGIFKFATTPNGSKPTRDDLFSTVTRGLAGSSMPEFRLLPESDRWNVVEYVRYLAVRGEFDRYLVTAFEQDAEEPNEDLARAAAETVLSRWSPLDLRPVYPSTPEPALTEETVAAGKTIYDDAKRSQCASCHGPLGRGDGPDVDNFTDAWGYKLRPRDFTRGVFRGGNKPGDLWLRIANGIQGSPMPAYGSALTSDEIWQVVHYVQRLAGQR